MQHYGEAQLCVSYPAVVGRVSEVKNIPLHPALLVGQLHSFPPLPVSLLQLKHYPKPQPHNVSERKGELWFGQLSPSHRAGAN
ncbi:uncharacterized [Tachysurus ichikawai]